MIAILIFLIAIVLANLSILYIGPQMAIWNSFILIGLDISLRDKLHERWHGKKLKRNIFFLVLTGAIITFLFNTQALWICIGSVLAFSLALFGDSYVYEKLFHKSKLEKMNISNMASALIDSGVFVLIALHFLPLKEQIEIISMMAGAKVLGGSVWAWVLTRKWNTKNV